MEAPQSSILQHTERGEVFVEEFLFYFILIPIARSQELLLLSVWNCTCSCCAGALNMKIGKILRVNMYLYKKKPD